MSILNETELQALREALDDEYLAWATYDQVIRDFGPERPFINIRRAEARHIEALRTLFQRYDVEVSENPWPGRVSRFASIREACEAGVKAEVANNALYEQLIHSTGRQDILAVFRNLQARFAGAPSSFPPFVAARLAAREAVQDESDLEDCKGWRRLRGHQAAALRESFATSRGGHVSAD